MAEAPQSETAFELDQIRPPDTGPILGWLDTSVKFENNFGTNFLQLYASSWASCYNREDRAVALAWSIRNEILSICSSAQSKVCRIRSCGESSKRRGWGRLVPSSRFI